jgi:hypothetical protein
MTPEMLIVFGLLGATIILFISDRLRRIILPALFPF